MIISSSTDDQQGHGYPRPQLRREQWQSLNGEWQFAIDERALWDSPDQPPWDAKKIIVPFSPEAPASGVNETGFFCACWYRRSFDAPLVQDGARLLLHFGAVDYAATVWVNEQLAVRARRRIHAFRDRHHALAR